jgi:hypothetical protein
VEDENKRLSAEAGDLRVARQAIDDLKSQVVSLEKDATSLKAAEEIALAQLEKVVASNEGLHKEIDAERSSSQALSA